MIQPHLTSSCGRGYVCEVVMCLWGWAALLEWPLVEDPRVAAATAGAFPPPSGRAGRRRSAGPAAPRMVRPERGHGAGGWCAGERAHEYRNNPPSSQLPLDGWVGQGPSRLSAWGPIRSSAGARGGVGEGSGSGRPAGPRRGLPGGRPGLPEAWDPPGGNPWRKQWGQGGSSLSLLSVSSPEQAAVA